MGGVVKSRGGGGGGEVMGWGGYLRPQPSSSVDVGSKASLAARSAQRKGMFCRKRKIEETGLFGGERGGAGVRGVRAGVAVGFRNALHVHWTRQIAVKE